MSGGFIDGEASKEKCPNENIRLYNVHRTKPVSIAITGSPVGLSLVNGVRRSNAET